MPRALNWIAYFHRQGQERHRVMVVVLLELVVILLAHHQPMS
jgi:hypothetical protein